MGKRRTTQEFGRLAVGIILLGLAIFLATNLDYSAAPIESNDGDSSAQSTAKSKPAWQAPARDSATAPPATMGEQVARPVFEPRPGTQDSVSPNTALASSQSGPDPATTPIPRLNDRYQAGSAFQVTGTLQQDNSLVPVQPKPGFAGIVRFAGGTHRVRDGDTLQSIAGEYYGSADRYLDIYLANKHVLSNPARLPEGVELRIPE